jgi:7,8-dihydro-6-hydroxymethylpterin-pyrophosphokinase
VKPVKIYLSLGSNVGDRVGNLRAAIAALPDSGVRVIQVSSFYETEPVD